MADQVSLASTSQWPVLPPASLVTIVKEPPGSAGRPIHQCPVSWRGCSWQPGLGSDSIIGARVIKRPLLSPFMVIV